MPKDRVVSTMTEQDILNVTASSLVRTAEQLGLTLDGLLEVVAPLARDRVKKNEEFERSLKEFERRLKASEALIKSIEEEV